ncbi:MAG: hypothetical protein AB2L14_00670 [Candidatus Xenobiia bacterium LiM19]
MDGIPFVDFRESKSAVILKNDFCLFYRTSSFNKTGPDRLEKLRCFDSIGVPEFLINNGV